MRTKLRQHRARIKALKEACKIDRRIWVELMQELQPPKDKGPIKGLPDVVWIGKEEIGSRKQSSLFCTPFGNIWAQEPLHKPKGFAKYKLMK